MDAFVTSTPLQNGGENHVTGAGDAPAAAKVKPKGLIEKIYQKKSQLEHILLRPDTYIGMVFIRILWYVDILIYVKFTVYVRRFCRTDDGGNVGLQPRTRMYDPA